MKKSVEEKIREIIEAMGIAYLFESWHGANVELDRKKRMRVLSYPICIHVLPQRGTIYWNNNGQIVDAPNCVLAFGDEIRLDAPADEVQHVVERMKQLAMQFVVRVNGSGLFEPVSGPIIYTCMFDKLDRNLALVTVELVLREIMGVCARNLTE